MQIVGEGRFKTQIVSSNGKKSVNLLEHSTIFLLLQQVSPIFFNGLIFSSFSWSKSSKLDLPINFGDLLKL
jgi:hypothetical protein